MRRILTVLFLAAFPMAVGFAPTARGLEYAYAPYNEGQMDPQLTGWPLTDAERAYALKPEHERRPAREASQHKPALWPVTPSAGFWGGTSWLDTHEKLVAYVRANQGPVDVLLVGDSITQQWGSPLDKGVLNEAWKKHFRGYKTINIGIGGDKTQNVLWRLDHGGVEGLEPRVVVVMIGNNMFFTPDNIHLSLAGYGVVAERLKPLLDRFLGGRSVGGEVTKTQVPGATKISWLNWGRQIRMLPPPNLMSSRYRTACQEKMRLLVPIILDWWQTLPIDQKHLLAGVKVGWESSIGVNNFYYPNGNDLLDKPADEDPQHGIKATEVPARGLVQLGYAAVTTAGIRTAGQITEPDLAEVARRHMEDLARLAAELGVPRDRLYTHGAGWKEKELLYGAAVNKFSCPGWSFYRHAGDPSQDAGVQEALARSDAPHWGAVEWLYQGPRTADAWRGALEKTLADPRCRLICIVNWSSIKDDATAQEALRQVTRSAG